VGDRKSVYQWQYCLILATVLALLLFSLAFPMVLLILLLNKEDLILPQGHCFSWHQNVCEHCFHSPDISTVWYHIPNTAHHMWVRLTHNFLPIDDSAPTPAPVAVAPGFTPPTTTTLSPEAIAAKKEEERKQREKVFLLCNYSLINPYSRCSRGSLKQIFGWFCCAGSRFVHRGNGSSAIDI